MISSKKLIKLARKWQRLVANRRKIITLPRDNIESLDTNNCSPSSTAEKGHFVVYSDQKRFLLPLEHLNNKIVRELLQMAEEEFGLSANGPLTLPCDAALVEYVITLSRRHATRDVEKSLLMSIARSCPSFSSDHFHQVKCHKRPIYSF